MRIAIYFLVCVSIVWMTPSVEAGESVVSEKILENPSVKRVLNACQIADKKAGDDCVRATKKLVDAMKKQGQRGLVDELQADLENLGSDGFSPYELTRHDTSPARREAAAKFAENRKTCVDELEKIVARLDKRNSDEEAAEVRALITAIKKKSVVFSRGQIVSLNDSLAKTPTAFTQGRFLADDNWIDNVRISPNGKIVVGTGGNGWAAAWNTETGKIATTFPDRKGNPFAGAFSADGRKYFVGCTNGWVCRYDVNTWNLEASMKQGDDMVLQLVPHSDGSVYTADSGEGIKRFDFRTNQTETFAAPRSARALELNKEETALLAGFTDGTVAIYDLKTKKPLNLWKHSDHEVQTVRFYKHSTQAISGSGDSTVAIWNTKTGERIVLFSDFPKAPRDLVFDKDESVLFVALSQWWDNAPDGTYPVVMIDLKTKLPVRSFPVKERCSSSVALAPDGKLHYTGGRHDDGVRIGNVPDRQAVEKTIKRLRPDDEKTSPILR